jgi:MoxR-like ATPase
MKKLHEFVKSINDNAINEGRPKKSDIDKVKNDPDPEKIVGKDADKNGTHGRWAVEEPYDDGAVEELDKTSLTRNMRRLLMKFKAKQPFFIQGAAGWGKTSIIKDMAKRYKRHIITVYLDKCQAVDLEGIPVPVKDEDGSVSQDIAMPKWAKYMKDHKDKQFLLFFDEMNQAQDDVMNALMPIVLERVVAGYKFDNFIVGAAGNFEEENPGGLSEMSKPLRERFKPIIIWSSGTEEDWREAFKFMHKKWDEKIGKKLIDDIYKYVHLFDNPRAVELKILDFLYEIKQDGDYDMFLIDDYKECIDDLMKEDLTASERKQEAELVDIIWEYMKKSEQKAEDEEEEEESGSRSSRRSNKEMISDSLMEDFKNGMKTGSLYEPDDNVRYGISRENIGKLFTNKNFNPEPMNMEMVNRLIKKFEADGIKFKYEKDAEFLKDKLKDPLEDLK